MRKAKVAAIVCGMIASCLFGGFAVVEAATITLDDSSADLVVYVQPATDDYEPEETAVAVTVTSIETTATAEARTTTVNYAGISAEKDNTKNETPAATGTAVNQGEVTTTTVTTATEVKTTETQVTTTTEVRAAKESAAHPAAETTAPAAATTTTVTTAATVAETVAVEMIPITEEISSPQMPAEQPAVSMEVAEQAVATDPIASVEAAPVISVEQIMAEPIMVEDLFVEDYEAFEMPDPTMLEVPAVQPVEAPSEAAPVQPDSNSVSVSESDYILLCNAVAHEAGSNSISADEKAKVVEVIMNRVNSPKYPDTVYGVLTQRYQFSGSSSYVDLGSFSEKVTDLVREAVDMYLSDPTQYNHGYLSFHGDGTRNYFS